MPDPLRPDPFDALRAPVVPVDPDAGFAARLRTRLERVLSIPEGVDMTDTTLDAPATGPAAGTASSALTPYLAVADARAALRWYREAFGAVELGPPVVVPDGRIGHAEMALAGARLMLSDQAPNLGVMAPEPDRFSVTLHLEVPDVDGLTDRAVAAGARLERPPADAGYGRNAVVVDPFGHRWMLMEPVPAPAPPARFTGGTRHGDLGYVSYQVPDVERAVAFYGAVLGWSFEPPAGPGHPGRLVRDAAPMTNLWPADGVPGLHLCWRVDDMSEARERVEAGGGSAGPVEQQDWGALAMCTDDQGAAFSLWEPTAQARAETAGIDPAARPLNGTRAGDISYMTMEVADSVRARAFYGLVLGWSFRPGRVPDGWAVEGPMPMHGLSGGHGEATAVAQFRVDDIHDAVARVRSAGGSATDPVHAGYGWSADCTDDQGVRFYLGQL